MAQENEKQREFERASEDAAFAGVPCFGQAGAAASCRDRAVAPRRERHYVDVIMRLRDDGRIVPLSICWPDGRLFCIDAVLSGPISNAPAAGARSLRFKVRIGSRVTYLFLEKTPAQSAAAEDSLRWYVELEL